MGASKLSLPCSTICIAAVQVIVGTVNFACYKHDAYDRGYEKLRVMPVGPARAPVFAELTALLDAHAPARILPEADDVMLAAPKRRGYTTHPYLPIPYYLLDVAPRAPNS